MKVTVKQYAASLYESIKGQSDKETSKIISAFVHFLGRRRELSKVPAIISAFCDIWDREEAEVSAELVTARPVKPVLGAISDYLKIKTSAKKINLKEVVETSLIGGFILRYQDRVLDASLKSNLEILQDKLGR